MNVLIRVSIKDFAVQDFDRSARAAAGRAYYAMYHAAYALVRTKGHAPKTHRGLLGLLGQDFVRAGPLSREDAATFTKAQALREWGDYEIGAAPTDDAAEEAIADAERFVARVRAILA